MVFIIYCLSLLLERMLHQSRDLCLVHWWSQGPRTVPDTLLAEIRICWVNEWTSQFVDSYWVKISSPHQEIDINATCPTPSRPLTYHKDIPNIISKYLPLSLIPLPCFCFQRICFCQWQHHLLVLTLKCSFYYSHFLLFIPQITNLWNSWTSFCIAPVCPFLSIFIALVHTIITSNRFLIGPLASSLSPLQVVLHIISIVLITSVLFQSHLWSSPPSKPDLTEWSNGQELSFKETESVA